MDEQILVRLDKMNDQLSDIDKRLEVYNSLLDIHIKRTEQNEHSIQMLREQSAQFQAGIKVLHWVIGTSVAVGGAIIALLQILK